MLKKIARFFKEYRQFGLVVISIIIALVLDLLGKDVIAHWILGISAAINVVPLIWDMIQDLRAGTYGVDILAATAIITAVVMHEYWAAMVIVFMLTGGEALEDYAEGRAKKELTGLLERKPQKAHLIKGRKTLDIKASEVKAGDKIIIKPGEFVPVDAVILEGNASFDESSLTGESLPLAKQAGDELLSGTINLDGAITAKALRAAKDSQFEQIVKLVKSASNSKAPFVRLADRYAVPFTLIAFIIAGAAWAISGESIRFLEVLVVATPCPLILAAPIAFISGMSREAKRGIIVKTGGALERLAMAKTFVFDKTGTLTEGHLVVDDVKSVKPYTPDELVTLAAALEQNSNHLVAQAIVNHAKDKGLKLPKIKQIEELSGKGLKGQMGRHQLLVGRREFLEELGIAIPEDFKTIPSKTAVYVAAANELVGAITLNDSLREKSPHTLEHLGRMGVSNILMITGDNEAVAKTIAKQTGIKDYVASALPADKIHAVEALKDRPVAFVGDGVNDAPVLAASDVGVALGARGSAAASESADIVIMVDDIEHVAVATAIAKKTLAIAKQSILIGIFISIGLMFVFSTGKFSPVLGAAIQEVVDVIVIFNALRALGPREKSAEI